MSATTPPQPTPMPPSAPAPLEAPAAPASTLDRLKAESAGLTEAERGELAEFLIRSLDPEPDGTPEEIAAAWRVEIARRLREHLDGTDPGIPAEVVLGRLREKYG